MRYLIASDIHGALPAAEALTTRFHEEGADRLLLLGDLLYHGPRNPLPEGYAPAEVAKLEKAYTIQKGKYVVVCVTEDIDNAKAVINQYF